MRLSDKQISGLQIILKELSLDYSDEKAQEVGMAIIRFAIAKARRDPKIMNDMERIWTNIEK